MGASLRRAELKGTGIFSGAGGFRVVTAAGPWLAAAVLALPVTAGLAFTLLPAFGWLPALGGDRLSLDPFHALFAQPGLWRSVFMSLATGLGATFLSLGLTAAFLAGFWGTAIFRRLQVLISPLLALPHAAAAFGLAFLVAPSGLLARLVSPELTGWTAPPDILIPNDAFGLTLTAALVAKETPFLLLMALAALPQTQASENARLAASLGYGRMAGFLHATWPQVYRQIRLPVLAVLAFSTSVVDAAAILGPTLPPTLAIRVTQWSLDPDLSRRFLAAAGSVLQLAVSLAGVLLWLALERLFGLWRRRLRDRGARWRHDAGPRAAALALQIIAVGSLLAGLAVLALWSLASLWPFPDALPQGLTWRGWADAAPRLAEPFAASLAIGAASAAAALAIAVLWLLGDGNRFWRKAGSILLYLPLIVPQASFLFGLQILFLLSGSPPDIGAVTAAHLVFVLPYAMLSLSAPWRAFDPRFEQVAASLGHGPWTVLFQVRLPMLLSALLVAFAVGFAVSVGLYLPTLLIGAGRVTTVTTEAVALASGGNRRVIGIYAVVQAALPCLGFALAVLLPRLLRVPTPRPAAEPGR